MTEQRMQSDDPRGGVVIVAMVVVAIVAWGIGVVVGFSAAALLR